MEPRRPGRPKRFLYRFNFALTEEQYTTIHTIADLARDEAAEVVRRMIDREAPFFMFYASAQKRLPNGEEGIP